MKRVLRSWLLGPLGYAGWFPTEMVERRRIVSLMERLHPRSGSQPLVRLGPMGDGGYLLPDDLAGIEACFSPGVSSVSGFESDCAERGMNVFLADKSVDGPALEHDRFRFTKKFVGATTDDDFITLDDWVSSAVGEGDSDLLLQMDVEGHEYEVLLAASDALMRRFRIVVAEFHGLDSLWSRPFFDVAVRAIDKLLQTHTCVHVHPNNWRAPLTINGLTIPPVMEFTFVRNDRVETTGFQTSFPHPLDTDNGPNRPVVLPECWYRVRG